MPIDTGDEEPNPRPARAGAILDELRASLRQPPPELPDEDYMRCHVAFENASDQQGLILEYLASRIDPKSSTELSILSVGAGSGILDVPLLTRLATRAAIDYEVVEPLPDQCSRLDERYEAAGPPANTALRIRNATLDAVPVRADFDVVLAIHSIYYMAGLDESLDRLLGMLRPGGTLLLAIAPLEAMNRLAMLFWTTTGDTVWFADDLEARLAERNVSVESERIDAHLRVPCAAIGEPDQATDAVDFLLQSPLDAQPAGTRALVQRFVSTIGATDGDHVLIPHPVMMYAVR